MFTSIRKYKVKRGSMEEYARRVQEGFVPLTRQMPGFRGYYLLDGGPDILITISMFDSADEAVASNVAAADWVRNNVLDLTKGMPEIMIGNALIAEVGCGTGRPQEGCVCEPRTGVRMASPRVDFGIQVVATDVVQAANDKRRLETMLNGLLRFPKC
jgi:hypothetical protein